MRQLFLLLTVLLLLAACSFATATPAGCQPSKMLPSQNGFPEVQGTMDSPGEMWALLFFDTAHVNEEEKIVWRITGEGDAFDVEAKSGKGTVIHPTWTDYHGASNWERPGQEWGTGFNFPEPGCWTMTVTRGQTTGTISLDVLASP